MGDSEEDKNEDTVMFQERKRRPSGRLGALTRKKNEILALMETDTHADLIQRKVKELNVCIQSFLTACEVYEEDMEEEAEKTELNTWKNENEEKFQHIAFLADEWCQKIYKNNEDKCSVKSFISKLSNRSSGSEKSVSESVKVMAIARKAELEAEKLYLQKQFDIKQEEILLEKKKEELRVEKLLSMEKAKLKAVEDPHWTANKNYDSSSSSNSESHLLKILEQQEQSTRLLLMQQQKASLPKANLLVYDGDPGTYQIFMNAFEHVIVEKTDNDLDRLYYLEQYTTGKPQQLVRSCLHMDKTSGYLKARQLLKEKFGDKFRITESHVSKLMDWPSIKSENSEDLEKLSIYMTSCCNMMEDIKEMSSLDQVDNLLKIISKLPYELRKKWRTRSVNIKKRKDRIAKFSDLVEFIDEQATEMSDPVFGKVADLKISVPYSKKELGKPKQFSANKSLATNVQLEQRPTASSVQVPVKTSVCHFCKKGHSISSCQEFIGLPYNTKREIVQRNKLCYGCLLYGHMSDKCRIRKNCGICNMRHPTALHMDSSIRNEKSITQPSGGQNIPENKSFCVEAQETENNTGAGKVYVAILPVKIKMKGTENYIVTYAALDPFSTAAFISNDIAEQLGVTGEDATISLTTMEAKNSNFQTKIISDLEICDLDENNPVYIRKAYTKPVLPINTEDLISRNALEDWDHLKELPLRYVEAGVGLLLGMNTPEAVKPLQIIDGKIGEPYAIRYRFGWAVNGPSNRRQSDHRLKSYMIKAEGNIERMLIKMYNEDFCDKQNSEDFGSSVEDKRWLSIVENNVNLVNGHYEVPLPFKSEVHLPYNKSLAIHRVQLLKRRFVRDDNFFEDYKSCIETLIKRGYVSEVKEQEYVPEGKQWFIPHHGVYHSKKPGKVRVVFDCSAKFNGQSLNAHLYQGPDLTNSLIGVLIRFRMEDIAFMADIESMFYQVRVPSTHSNFLKFLWWPEGKFENDVAEFKINTHPFGAVSSPSCCNYALKKTAEDNSNKYGANVISTVRRNFYVDDCLRSIGTEKEAIILTKDLKRLLMEGGFNLTKFISNSRMVMNAIDENDKANSVKSLDLSIDSIPTERALGLEWSAETDCFKFTVNLKYKEATRRNILSMVSSLYDPLGFVGPIILPAKILLQELCRMKLDWDDPIPVENKKVWMEWTQNLEKLSEFSINRCVKRKVTGKLRRRELHHFSDASHTGYGVASYLRFVTDEQVHCSFIFGKARCAPLKTVTVPRLELTAATLSIRMDKLIRKELDFEVDDSYFWTDSTTVLRYIKNESRRFHIFVANRIQTIHDGSTTKQWHYVDTKLNPADWASRGVSVDHLTNNPLWISGPPFLWKHTKDWPQEVWDSSLSFKDTEVKVNSARVTSNSNETDLNLLENLITKCSSWLRLKRIVAWVFRAKQRFQNPKSIVSKYLTADELEAAETHIVKFVQAKEFSKEIAALASAAGLSKGSSISRLDPFIEDGLVRVGGRLRRSDLSHQAQHPIIIPKNGNVSKLLVRYYHEIVGHMGRETLLLNLREKYWLIGANVTARAVIKSCIKCRKRLAKVETQKMSDLPIDRVLGDVAPFTNVGVDYFGPFLVKRGRTQEKRYGCVFTCLNIRAIHLEVAESLNTSSFINCLRRFIARRGQVKIMRSDNGTNFRAAEKELKAAVRELDCQRIGDFLAVKDINWIFNPPSASHHGGVWERMIRSIRSVLQSITTEQVMTDEELRTVFCEVEAIINSRPLTNLSEDPNDLRALSPSHLLTMKCSSSFPPGVFSENENYSRRKWRQIQYMADVFWKRWKSEYLHLLQSRQKWTQSKRNIATGDLVLVVDENSPRGSWKLGRVVSTRMDSRGFVRTVEVMTSSATMLRPISKLCLLKTVEELEA